MITIRAMAGDNSALGQTVSNQNVLKVPAPGPQRVYVNLGQFSEWKVELRGEIITITAEELFSALKGRP